MSCHRAAPRNPALRKRIFPALSHPRHGHRRVCAPMSPMPAKPTYRFRTVFISDVHLGFRGCRGAYLLDSLRSVETETLYLVGDIIDLWSLRKSFFWPQAHNDVIRTLLGKAKRGTRVIYIPGNTDATFRAYAGLGHG